MEALFAVAFLCLVIYLIAGRPHHSKRSVGAMMLFAVFFPVQLFFLGRPGLGVLFWLTGGGLGVWYVIEWFLTPKRVRDYNRTVLLADDGAAPVFVYLMQLTYKNGRPRSLVKVGVGGMNRIRDHERRGWRLMHLESFQERVQAVSVENQVLNRIRSARADPVPPLATAMMFQGGQTEITTLPASVVKRWIIDVSRRVR